MRRKSREPHPAGWAIHSAFVPRRDGPRRLEQAFQVLLGAETGVPIATEKKTTNLARGPGSTAFSLLETRLRGADSRNRIRERLSRIKNPRNHVVSPEGLGASRLPSFARWPLNSRNWKFVVFFSAAIGTP